MRPEWLHRVRRNHPRLFFNADTWPRVKDRALNRERAWYDALKERVDACLSDLEKKDWGSEAAEAAFVFRMTGDERYLKLVRDMLRRSIAFYDGRNKEEWAANWYSTTRVNAWCAYDWVYDALSDGDRIDITGPFLDHVEYEQVRRRPGLERHNLGGPKSGFYGSDNLLWFAGLSAFDDGIDDARALDFLVRGYELNQQMLTHRREACGDDGGSASPSLNYAMGAYPWAEFNFFHTMISALGQDISGAWPHVAYFVNYVIWNWLPGARTFGTADDYHIDNALRLYTMPLHMAQTLHFYGRSQPECAALARWMLDRVTELGYDYGRTWPCHPFLLNRLEDVPPARGPSDTLPPARHFENMGQIFMRSGSGPDDTYVLFTAGGLLRQHKHYDNNNFTIFKKGFLALDTGSRPEPGQHLFQYYARTVAHNCILIHMPGEELPKYWGNNAPGETDYPPSNDGGQNAQLGSVVPAFETGPDMSYAASDATPCYNPEKCELALRQLVFLPPDHLVVFDRVTSTHAEYGKAWLLHTAREPAVDGMVFHADQEEGRLFCRTLLPEDATLTKIGGPGRQFWADGRNWPIPPGWRAPDTTELLGQWRIEVSPGDQRKEDLFLHVIQVGDRTELTAMSPVELIREGETAGARIQCGGRTWEVRFATQGDAGGHIRIVDAGRVVMDRALAGDVTPQVGLLGGVE